MRSHYVCWERSDIFDILNTEADKIDPAVFMAVHTDRPMTRYERHLGRRDDSPRGWPMSAEEFLAEFIAEGPNHVQAVILGGAGSGKSHFIKWLEFNLPRDGRFRLLSIPKMSIGLRDVIGMIIDVLPEAQRREYREHLNRSGFEVVTRDLQKHRLLAEISLAIRALRADVPQKAYLVEGLPLLFEDPEYKASLIAKEASVLDDLVDHIVATPKYERRTERRQFERSDLPLHGLDLAPLSEMTRSFVRQLMARETLVEPALRVINEGTDAAIGRVLDFPDARLLGLMRDVRRYLKQQGEALVLLVEDFAVMQGVDFALLQALTERASDAADGLCEIRWAMAMTTGYYEVLPDTFTDRMDLLVGMDLKSLGGNGATGEVGMTPQGVVDFAARYLRASRLTKRRLEDWYNESRDEQPEPPSKCKGCDYAAECHDAFGEVDGVGLYPFSRNALHNILSRADPTSSDVFNPRAMIRDVLRPWLGDKVGEFERGRFPSRALLDSLGGSTLGAADRDRHPDLSAGHLAVLEFWGVPGHLTAVHPVTYEAFGLAVPQLDPSEVTGPGGGSGKRSGGRKETTDSEDSLEGDFAAIEAWGRGEKVSQEVVQRVRDAVYEAMVEFIDWDTLGIQRNFVAGTAAPALFRPRSVTLRRQETKAQATPIQLEIPLADDETSYRDAVLALKGLLELRRRGGVEAPDALLKSVRLRRALAEWSNEIIRQAALLTIPNGISLLDATIALLATQAAMTGAVRGGASSKPTATLVFGPLPQMSDASSDDWRGVYGALARRRAALVEIARAFLTGTKGGQKGKFVDAARLRRSYKAFAKSWDIGKFAAADFSGTDAGRLVTPLIKQVSEKLPSAIMKESEAAAAWLETVSSLGATSNDAKTAISEMSALLDMARAVPIRVSPQLQEDFANASASLGPITFARAVGQAREVAGGDHRLMIVAAEDLMSARSAATDFVSVADRVLAQLEAAAQSNEATMTQLQQQLSSDRDGIEFALAKLPELLARLEVGPDG